MAERVLCLDTSVIVKALTAEAGHREALAVLTEAVDKGHPLIAPAFATAEVGSALRGKLRRRQADVPEIEVAWSHYLALPITSVDSRELYERSWSLAARHHLPTLYDAVFLACTELALEAGSAAEYWTEDHALVGSLGRQRPAYVRTLSGT